jgi:predicted nucleotidyltransferase
MIGEIEGVLEALNRARVRYLVVGGVAVVLHGYLRTTADLDLVIQLERENILRAIDALAGLGYRSRLPVDPASLADAETRRQWIQDKNLMVFSMWSAAHAGLEVDIFVEEPFDFDQVYSRALRVPLERIEITVVALDDLLTLKRKAGRPLDQQDVAALESLRTEAGPGPQEGNDDQP